MFSRWKFQIALIAIIAVFAVLAGAFRDEPVAYAQEDDRDRDYVDVALTLEAPHDHLATTLHLIHVIVVNHGTRTAYDVEVVVNVESPDDSDFVTTKRGDIPALGGDVSLGETEEGKPSLSWTIPELGALQREVLTPLVRHEKSGAGAFDNSADPHEIFGTVTTTSFESDLHKGNNTSRVWSFAHSTRHNNWIQAAVDYTVDVSVDNRSPSPGETVNFTITAGRESRHSIAGPPPPIDLKVDIGLTGDLSHTGTASHYSTNSSGATNLDSEHRQVSASFSDGVFNIATGKATHQSVSDSVTLPVTVSSSPLNEQCLTATLIGNPPPGNGPLDDDISDNVAKLCLGDPSREPLVSGEVEIFTIYDCFARRTAPCPGTDGVRVRAVNKNIGSGVVMPPGTTIIQVQDPIARVYDSYIHPRNRSQQSVNNANTVSWQTATDAHANFSGTRKGVRIFFSRIPFNGQLNNWVKVAGEHVTVKGVNGGDPPGNMYIRGGTGSAFTQMKSGNSWTVTYSGTSSKMDSLAPGAWFTEFSKLGTYVLEYTTIGNRDGTNGDCAAEYLPTGVDAAYCDTETYTFHVGPMADLAVEDGGASSHVAEDQHALTIVAVNNGPNNAGSAQITGLPTDANVLHVTQGAYNSTSGEWDIGELRPRGHYSSRGETEPTLVLSVADGTTASVSIANTENYEVCVGGKANPGDLPFTTQATCEVAANANASWNSTPVYDYNTANNTATITATAGAGLPASVTVVGTDAGGFLLEWPPVEQVNGLYVTRYEVQRSASPWMTLADDVTGTMYLDEAPDGDNPEYRVRAMNAKGVPGPWSEPSSRTPGVPKDFSASIATGNTQINLSWSAPDDVTGVTVSGYDVEYWDGATWTSLAMAQSALTYPHTGLTLLPGAVWQYRVRTVGTDGGETVKSEWATASVEVEYPKPNVPTMFTATGSSDREATLSWTAPVDVDNVTVTGYDLDFSKDRGSTWTSLAMGQTTASFTHTDNTLGANVVRQYRLRAVGTVGSGSEQVTVKSDWAFTAATREYPTPGAPRNFIADAISQSQVNLSWSVPEAVTGVDITGYDLEFSTDGAMWTSLAQGRTETTFPHTNNALAAGVIRQYRLRAVGQDSNSAVFRSGWVFASAATEQVGAPQGLSATAHGSGRIDLSWGLPDFGESLVNGYRIDYTLASPEEWETLEHGHPAGASPRRYEHHGLSPGQRYCYRVAAVHDGGTGPFSSPRACATTEVEPTVLPGQPENLRITQVGRDYVTLEWDKPSAGGAVEYYQWRSNAHGPTRVPGAATRVRVGSLATGSTYDFQVRAWSSSGAGQWSGPVQATLNQAGGAVVASPLELKVTEGGSGRFNVRLKRSPEWPLQIYFHFEGPGCLTESLSYQQAKILLPSNPKPSKEFWNDGWWGPPDDRHAAPWNVGLNFQVDVPADAAGCKAGATAVVNYDLVSLPFSYVEGIRLWEQLGLNEEEWRDKWGIDPLDGTIGPSVKLTVVEGTGSGRTPGGEQGLASVNVGGTALNVSVTLPPPAAVWRREEPGLYGSQPAWDWWD